MLIHPVVLIFKLFFLLLKDFHVSDMAQPFTVVVFHCRHMFHKECLPSSGTVSWHFNSLPVVLFY